MEQNLHSAPPAAARVQSVDCAKSIAIVYVLLIHVSSEVLRGSIVGSVCWLSALFWGSLARGAVPLFLLCSGALLLDPAREVTARHIWRRNIPHILLALFVWAAFYKALGIAAANGVDAAMLRGAFRDLMLWRHEAHLYYLPIILLVYAALPLTRVFTRCAGEKTLHYFLGFWLVFGVLLPSLQILGLFEGFGGILRQWPLPMAWSVIGCTVLGDALRRRPYSVRAAAALIAGGFVLCFAGTWLLSARAGELKTPLLEGFSLGPCMMAAGVFSLCVHAGPRLPRRLRPAVQRLSKASFCMYLVHIAVLRLMYAAGLGAGRSLTALTIPAAAAICGACSFLVYLMLSRIPWVRRWLI